MTDSDNLVPADEDGEPFRPGDSQYLWLPDLIDVEGDRLLWSVRSHDRRQADPRMLSQFIRLADASDEAIARFARSWGSLRLCRHGLPYLHARRHVDDPWPCPLSERQSERAPWVFWERLDEWRRYAREARAILTISNALHANKAASPEAWRGIPSAEDKADRLRVGWSADLSPLDFDRALVSTMIGDWLRYGQVAITLDWTAQKPQVRTGGVRAFGALAAFLLDAVARSDGPVFCSACGKPDWPERRPNPNRRTYCDDCRGRADRRDATRDYRARRRVRV